MDPTLELIKNKNGFQKHNYQKIDLLYNIKDSTSYELETSEKYNIAYVDSLEKRLQNIIQYTQNLGKYINSNLYIESEILKEMFGIHNKKKELLSVEKIEYNFKKLISQKILNRAFFKLFNIDIFFNIINVPENKSSSKVDDKFTFLDLCGAPGGFTQYIISKLNNINYKGYGMSLRDTINWNIKDENFEILWGSKNNGDICDINNIEYILSKCEKVDLVVSDGGINKDTLELYEEELMKRLIVCEINIAINVLKKGGNFVIKVFEMYTDFALDVIQLLAMHFEIVCIFKPITSRLFNSEKYIVCKSFTGNIKISKANLYNLSETLQINYVHKFLSTKNQECVKYLSYINNLQLIQQVLFMKYKLLPEIIGINHQWDTYDVDIIPKLWGIPSVNESILINEEIAIENSIKFNPVLDLLRYAYIHFISHQLNDINIIKWLVETRIIHEKGDSMIISKSELDEADLLSLNNNEVLKFITESKIKQVYQDVSRCSLNIYYKDSYLHCEMLSQNKPEYLKQKYSFYVNDKLLEKTIFLDEVNYKKHSLLDNKIYKERLLCILCREYLLKYITGGYIADSIFDLYLNNNILDGFSSVLTRHSVFSSIYTDVFHIYGSKQMILWYNESNINNLFKFKLIVANLPYYSKRITELMLHKLYSLVLLSHKIKKELDVIVIMNSMHKFNYKAHCYVQKSSNYIFNTIDQLQQSKPIFNVLMKGYKSSLDLIKV